MKILLISFLLQFIFAINGFSQDQYDISENIHSVKIMYFKNGKLKKQQLILISVKDSVSNIEIYDKYSTQLKPKENISEAELKIANELIALKKRDLVPIHLYKHLKIPINDSLSVLQIVEIFSQKSLLTKNNLQINSLNQKIYKFIKLNKKSNYYLLNIRKRVKIELECGNAKYTYYFNKYYVGNKMLEIIKNGN